jgi:DGQHR domain-containing protein
LTNDNYDIELPVAIIEGLNLEEQVQYFIDINGQQRGVPRALRLEVEKFLLPEDTPEAFRHALFKHLNDEPDSPLYNKMSRTVSVRGKLTHVALEAALKHIQDQVWFSSKNTESKIKLILNYLRAVESILIDATGKSDILTHSARFQAFFGAFDLAQQKCFEKHKNYKESSFKKIISGYQDIDWEAPFGTNKKAILDLSHLLISTIQKLESDDDDLY